MTACGWLCLTYGNPPRFKLEKRISSLRRNISWAEGGVNFEIEPADVGVEHQLLLNIRAKHDAVKSSRRAFIRNVIFRPPGVWRCGVWERAIEFPDREQPQKAFWRRGPKNSTLRRFNAQGKKVRRPLGAVIPAMDLVCGRDPPGGQRRWECL